MPNIITHKIFAEEVYKRIRKKDIKELIEKHFQLYYIGSNGPDFLFFHHALPWEKYKDNSLRKLGSRLHKEGINAFYESAVMSMQKEKDTFHKESELAYVMGHLCHWSLDMMAHPYIFHKTGDAQGESAGLHHRFESMLDAIMLKKFHNLTIEEYKSYEICAFDEDMLRAIARIYVPAAKTVFDQSIKVYEIRKALTSWGEIQRFLYDPKHRLMPVLKGFEKVLKKPWFLSGNIIPKELDETYDILNETHASWHHPCDPTMLSTASFLELFDQAIDQAVMLLEKVYGCVEYDASINSLLHIIQDRAYDTGMEGYREMKCFNIIYKDGKNESI